MWPYRSARAPLCPVSRFRRHAGRAHGQAGRGPAAGGNAARAPDAGATAEGPRVLHQRPAPERPGEAGAPVRLQAVSRVCSVSKAPPRRDPRNRRRCSSCGRKPRRGWPACRRNGSKTKGWPSFCITGCSARRPGTRPGGWCARWSDQPAVRQLESARTDTGSGSRGAHGKGAVVSRLLRGPALRRGAGPFTRRRPVGRGGVPRRASWRHHPSRAGSPHAGQIPAGGRERRP